MSEVYGVISAHEKGFWNIDFYDRDPRDYPDDEAVGYRTSKLEEQKVMFLDRVRCVHKGIVIIEGWDEDEYFEDIV